MQITVWQHVFTNVPKEQSPRGKRGYQTLLYSQADLSRDDVMLLEERALYYGGDSEPVKYQFWMLPGERAVVTQILPLPEPDEFGRKGRYFAHSLIVSPADFRALGFYPLTLLDEALFLRRPDQALAHGNAQTGDLPVKRVEVNEHWTAKALQATQNWRDEELMRLACLGWNVKQLRDQRKAVTFLGDNARQFLAMAGIFLLAPLDLRPQLSFDTYTFGCDWSRNWPFWAWGGMEDPRQAAVQVDGSGYRVNGEVLGVPERSFFRWAVRSAIPQRLRGYEREYQPALLLESVLQGRRARVDSVPDGLGLAFCVANQQAILNWLAGQYPPELSAEFRHSLAVSFRAQLWDHFRMAAPGLDARRQADTLYRFLASGGAGELSKGDLKPLTRLAEDAGHPQLDCLARFYAGDRRGWETALGKLSPADYLEVAQQLLARRRVTALDLFQVERLADWSQIPGLRLGPGELDEVLKRIKKEKEPVDADALMPLLPALQPHQRQLLIEWLQSYPGPAPQLRASLGIPEPEERTRRGRLRGLLGRE